MRKIPYILKCFKCLRELELTEFDSGEYLIFRCPSCGMLVGVKRYEG